MVETKHIKMIIKLQTKHHSVYNQNQFDIEYKQILLYINRYIHNGIHGF